MPSSRRNPSEIALELLDCIDEKGEATRGGISKILGTTWQFHQWVENFLMKEKLVEKRRESKSRFYRKTESGELFHRLLRNGKIMKALLRVGVKRLKGHQTGN